MRLLNLLTEVDYELCQGEINISIDDITYNSRENTKDTVFVAVAQKEEYIDEAIKKGAIAVVYEGILEKYNDGITYIKVKDIRKALSYMSNAYFSYPSKDMYMIGITGTKGKTTTAYMIHSILSTCGIKCGLIGTIETIYGEEWYPQCNTTPESYVLFETLSKMRYSGIKVVVMEVSSQGLMMERVAGITFDIGIFTNISEDHIGLKEHSSFEEYLYYKSRLFVASKCALVNIDDKCANYIIAAAVGKIKTYGIEKKGNLNAADIRLLKDSCHEGVTFDALGKQFRIHLPGKFNVYNSLAAILATSQLTTDINSIAYGLENVAIKGRLEILKTKFPFTIVIDYAHNELSLKKLLETLREYNPNRLICCFGCGGNRDKSRRYKMGRVSGELCDITIVTSDNPRYEDPVAIMDEIISGIKELGGIYIPIVSRREAIEYALSIGEEGDIIVFAGKGHEDYEEVCGKRSPFNEKNIIRQIQNSMIK